MLVARLPEVRLFLQRFDPSFAVTSKLEWLLHMIDTTHLFEKYDPLMIWRDVCARHASFVLLTRLIDIIWTSHISYMEKSCNVLQCVAEVLPREMYVLQYVAVCGPRCATHLMQCHHVMQFIECVVAQQMHWYSANGRSAAVYIEG